MIDCVLGVASSCDLPFGPLATPRDILRRTPASGADRYDARTLQDLIAMAGWVTEFLTGGHPTLGRPGAVCPFVAKALEQGLIRLTAFDPPGEDEDDAEAAVTAGMIRLRAALSRLGAGACGRAELRHRAIVAVFPHLSGPVGAALIERVQKRLKPAFVEQALMIGQFHPACPEPGLWNRSFRPLQAPAVSLAIRNITLFDAPFMLERAEYVEAFVRLFGQAGEERIARALGERDAPGAADAAGLVSEARA